MDKERFENFKRIVKLICDKHNIETTIKIEGDPKWVNMNI